MTEEQKQLDDLLFHVSQVFDGWHQDGTAWSEWDESVRKRVTEERIKLKSQPITVAEPINKELLKKKIEMRMYAEKDLTDWQEGFNSCARIILKLIARVEAEPVSNDWKDNRIRVLEALVKKYRPEGLAEATLDVAEPVSPSEEEQAIKFAEWIRDEMYVRYFGNDGPNCNKWYKQYTTPDRKYFSSKELFELFLTRRTKQ